MSGTSTVMNTLHCRKAHIVLDDVPATFSAIPGRVAIVSWKEMASCRFETVHRQHNSHVFLCRTKSGQDFQGILEPECVSIANRHEHTGEVVPATFHTVFLPKLSEGTLPSGLRDTLAMSSPISVVWITGTSTEHRIAHRRWKSFQRSSNLIVSQFGPTL